MVLIQLLLTAWKQIHIECTCM